MTATNDNEKSAGQTGDEKKQKPRKPLLDPDQPRITVTDGAEFTGPHPTQAGPDIVHPGGGTPAGQTTHE